MENGYIIYIENVEIIGSDVSRKRPKNKDFKTKSFEYIYVKNNVQPISMPGSDKRPLKRLGCYVVR